MFTMKPNWGSGSGSALPFPVLLFATLCTLFSVFFSAMSIFLHFKNYRKPQLQRMVVRIMLMVPIYAVASLISLFSLDAAFVIDAIRDIYEAFVIYCFFNLLLGYLGGERSLLIRLHGREPKPSVFPMSLFKREIDVSDPYFFLFLKRGIIQYVQIKPILAVATLILKALGKFNEGDLRANSGYLYVSIVYNISICLSLYCLAMFWLCVSEDLTPYRPMPKFLCVKGILFFSFWESFCISILVAAGAIKRLGPYTDSEHISLGLTDTLICFEMPIFAVAHLYAFSHTDYIDPKVMYSARMPIYYAMRDAFGFKDVVEDSKATLRGKGMDYREFEPAEGLVHQGAGRERRIKAGLRYSKGGQNKYWLPMPAEVPDRGGILGRTARNEDDEEVYAPLMEDQAADVVHEGPRSLMYAESRGFDLPFGDPDEEDDILYEQSRNYLFGDYLYPCIDVSSESARRTMWEEEERILRNERGAYFSPVRRTQGLRLDTAAHPVYGATQSTTDPHSGVSRVPGKYSPKGKERDTPTGEPQARWRDEGYLVDKSELSIPAPMDAVRLGWTGSRHVLNRASSRSSQQTQQGRPIDSQERRVSAPSARNSPTSSNAGARPRKVSQLPSDAVDLVLERKDGKLAANDSIAQGGGSSRSISTDNLLQNTHGVAKDSRYSPEHHEPNDTIDTQEAESSGIVTIEVSPPSTARLDYDMKYHNTDDNPWT